MPAVYTLEVVFPKPTGTSPTGIDGDNRSKFALQGVEYAIPLAATGGMPPLAWTGSNLPSGAVVESYPSQSGESLWRLRWPNPQTDASDVQVCVEDIHEASDCETFSIDVQAAGSSSRFRFVDAVDGNDSWDGTSPTFVSGTTGPWRTLSAVWSQGRMHQIIYFMAGVYNVDGITLASGGAYANFDYGGNGGLGRPTQWLNYPNESPELDLQSTGSDTPYINLSEAENAWVEGFEVYGDWTKSFEVGMFFGRGSVWWNNNFHTGGDGGDGSNSAFIMMTSNSSNQSYGTVIANNIFGSAGHNAIKAYTALKLVIEGNLLDGNDGMAMKADVEQYSIQFNKAQNLTSEAGAGLVTGNHNATHFTESSGETRFNAVLSTSSTTVYLVRGGIANVAALHIYRNTFVGTAIIDRLGSAEGARTFTRNVIINATAASGSCPAKFTCTSVTDFTKLVLSSNLTGVTGDNIVSASGDLQGSYLTDHGPASATPKGHMMDTELSGGGGGATDGPRGKGRTRIRMR